MGAFGASLLIRDQPMVLTKMLECKTGHLKAWPPSNRFLCGGEAVSDRGG